MTLHLIKLCVGCESVESLAESQRRQAARAERELGRRVAWHTTRMMPRRREELLDGGSLYWIIKGQIRAREPLVDVREIVDGEGRRACVLELEPEPIRVQPRNHRPFQGWRYLPAEKAPPDLDAADEGVAEMPEWMIAELKELGLL
jgi:hypothetical protein